LNIEFILFEELMYKHKKTLKTITKSQNYNDFLNQKTYIYIYIYIYIYNF